MILHVLLVAVLTLLAVGSAIAGVVLACLCWSVVRGWLDDRDRVRRIHQCVLLADHLQSGRGGEVDAEAIRGRSGRVHVDDGGSCRGGGGAFKLESFPVGVVRHLWWLVSHHAGHGSWVDQERMASVTLYPPADRRVKAEPLNEEKEA